MMKFNLFFTLCFVGILLAGCSSKTDLSAIDESDAVSIAALDVANKYIVVLNDNVDFKQNIETRNANVKAKANGLLKKYDVSGDIEEIYESSIKGFTIRLAPGQAKKLEADPLVKLIETDKIVSLSPIVVEGKPTGGSTQPSQVIPWGITRVGGNANATISGTAWIIDTGIDYSHPDLNVDKIRSKSFLGTTTTPDDQNGHGTHVAGIIGAYNNSIGVVGVAPGATLVAVRVLNRKGSGTISEIIAGVNYVAANGVAGDVANMSLGGGISTALDQAVAAAATNVKFVLAAGNESDDADNHSPARVDGTNIFTISAMDINNAFASFSNYGSHVDYCAPGVSIYSTYKGSTYATLSGTSMAAPHVTGLLLIGAIQGMGYVTGDPDGNADIIAHH